MAVSEVKAAEWDSVPEVNNSLIMIQFTEPGRKVRALSFHPQYSSKSIVIVS